MPKPLKIVLHGPESTGKTELCAQLAAHFRTVWTPEFARHFLDVKGEICAEDVWPIFYGAAAWQIADEKRARKLWFCDTDALATKIYAAHYYGAKSPEITEFARCHLADFYLLCDIDLPWTPDGAQRDLGHLRPQMMRKFRDELEFYGAPFALVRGFGETRFAAALRALQTQFPDASM